MDTRAAYPSDLTPAEWAQVCRVIPAPKPGGRPAKHDRREIVNALLYLNRTGWHTPDADGFIASHACYCGSRWRLLRLVRRAVV
jgi:transposase